MILDNLSQWRQYSAISHRFGKAFEFLQTLNEHTPVGRHDISGEEVYAIVARQDTRKLGECEFEAHRRYIDVHYICRGRETIYWAPLALLQTVIKEFDYESDAALYALVPEAVPLRVRAGQFLILFPEDGHVPSCEWDHPAEVFKAVVKVQV